MKWGRHTLISMAVWLVAPARPNNNAVTYSSPTVFMYAAHQAVIAMMAVGKTKDDRRPYLMVKGIKTRHPMARPTNAHDKEFAIS